MFCSTMSDCNLHYLAYKLKKATHVYFYNGAYHENKD